LKNVETVFLLPEGGIHLEQLEKSLISQALERTFGNQSAAARLLGISRFTLRYRMEKYGLFPTPVEQWEKPQEQ